VVSSRRVRKGPGRRPQSAKRQLFLKLLARGWTPAAARREVGISRSASRNWRYGYKVYLKNGTVRFVPPLDPLTARAISPRFLSGLNESRSPTVITRAKPYAPSPPRSDAHRRRSAASCVAMPVELGGTTRMRLIVPPRCAGNADGLRSWPPIQSCSRKSKSFWRNGGARLRSVVHCAVRSRTAQCGISHRRRFTRSCIDPTVCCCVARHPRRCVPVVITAAPTCASLGAGGASANRCSACISVRFLPRTARSPATGRAT